MPRQALLILAVAIAALALPASATAVPLGGLTQPSGTSGCVNYDGSDGCATDALLDGVTDVAISPDGKTLYATSYINDSIVGFSRDPISGVLSNRVTCATRAGHGGLHDAGAQARLRVGGRRQPRRQERLRHRLHQPDSADLRPQHVDRRARQLPDLQQLGGRGRLHRRRRGTPERRRRDRRQPRRQERLRRRLAGPTDIDALRPRLERQPSTFAYCFNAAGGNGCDAAATPSLQNPLDVATSPDGKNVYVASNTIGVASFSRSDTGSINPLPGSGACIAASTPPCAAGHDLFDIRTLSISPDGSQRLHSRRSAPTRSACSRERPTARSRRRPAPPARLAR